MNVRNLNKQLTGYLFISPFVLGFLAFTIIPIGASFYLSFTDYDLFTPPRWTGLANYRDLFFADSKYWQSVKVTFLYVFFSVPLRLAFALFIAMLLNTATRAIGLYRTMYYLPSIIGGSVAVSIMWRNLFGDEGIVNLLLQFLGLDAVRWFGNSVAALWMLILLAVWQFGSSMLIFLAGLKNIPQTYYEAAAVDGAGPVQRCSSASRCRCSAPVILFNVDHADHRRFHLVHSGLYYHKRRGRPPRRNAASIRCTCSAKASSSPYGRRIGDGVAAACRDRRSADRAPVRHLPAIWVHYESKGGN